MKNILVPVDFSHNAFSAFHYATQLAHTLSAKVTLIHVINGSFNTNQPLGYEPIKSMEEAMMERLRYFAVEYPHEVGTMIKNVPIEYEVRFGIPGFTIANYTKDQEVDLIVMGTRDKHGIFDKILGSTSSITISVATCPIITVHENTKYSDLEKIVFGFDTKKDVDDAVEFLKEYNENFNANIDFVHVEKDEEEVLTPVMKEIVEEMLDDQISYSFEIKKIKGRDTATVLSDYCINNKADMLVLYHRKANIWNRLFKPSVSVKSAHQFHLPVMILPDND